MNGQTPAVKAQACTSFTQTARLLTPAAAAAYLALGSRWAVYRLIKAGTLPSVMVLGKRRIDRLDLDALIELLKDPAPVVPPLVRVQARRVPVAALAPLARRRKGENGDRAVTASAQPSNGAGRPRVAPPNQSVVPHLRQTP